MNNKQSLTDRNSKLKLVAVTKGRSIEQILEMLEKTDAKRIGENRLQEAKEKFPKLPAELEKHFLGKLQSRKIPEIVQLFDVIQSVENLEQAKFISKEAKEIKVFLQINISDLPQRSGCHPDEALKLIKEIQSLPHINLIGVMGMASQNPDSIRKEFQLLKSLQANLPECSMGMSGDYQIAIEEGSTMLRLGTALFTEPVLQFPVKFE